MPDIVQLVNGGGRMGHRSLPPNLTFSPWFALECLLIIRKLFWLLFLFSLFVMFVCTCCFLFIFLNRWFMPIVWKSKCIKRYSVQSLASTVSQLLGYHHPCPILYFFPSRTSEWKYKKLWIDVQKDFYIITKSLKLQLKFILSFCCILSITPLWKNYHLY